MHTIKKKLPGLNGIITFDAAARPLSFTAAADELCVSQAAVSRQIRRLEQQLGVGLFIREHRRLRLSSAGATFQQAVSFGLEHIADAAWKLSAKRSHRQIQVAATSACATFWLMPRLNRFREQFPQLDIRVVASDRFQDHYAAGIDIAIACGKPELPDHECQYLFPETVYPVCSPQYMAAGKLQNVADLCHQRLLHLDQKHWQDVGWEPIDWTRWLEQFGVPYQPEHPLMSFNLYPMLLQAAMAGEGIALGWHHLTEQLLADGRLVRPIDTSWDSQRAYYLLVLADRPVAAEVLALQDWLLQHR
jgi:DNA-binding transcriptional LysR family regulator